MHRNFLMLSEVERKREFTTFDRGYLRAFSQLKINLFLKICDRNITPAVPISIESIVCINGAESILCTISSYHIAFIANRKTNNRIRITRNNNITRDVCHTKWYAKLSLIRLIQRHNEPKTAT